MSPIPTSTVRCARCSKTSGRIVNSVFSPEPGGRRPVTSRSGSRCGHCGGGLVLEPEGAVTPEQANFVDAVRIAGNRS